MIEFENVNAKNFGCFKELKFPIKDQGLVLILGQNKNTSGSNGSGKSMLAEAIFFPLFDALLRDIRPPSIINISVGKDMLVENTIRIGGKQYTIRNGRKVGSKNKIYEVIDGTGESLGLPEDWWIERAGYSKVVFSGLAVVSGGTPHPLVHGTDKAKKEYLTDLFELQIYDECLDVVKARLSGNNKRLTELQALSESKERELEKDKGELISDKEFEKQKKEMETTQGLLTELQEALDDNLSRLGEIKIEKEHAEKQQKLLDKIGEIQSVVTDLKIELGDRVNKLAAGKKKVDTLSKEAHELTAQIKLLRRQMDKIQELEDSCPTCLQPITEEKKQELLKDLKGKENTHLEEKMQIDKTLAKGKDLVQKVEDYISKRERLKDLQEQVSEVSVSGDLESLMEEVENLRTEINTLQAEKMLIRTDLNRYELLTERITEGTVQLNKWAYETKEIEDTLKYWEFLSQAFGQYGIKSMKMDNILDTLNYHIAEYMDFLTFSKISAMYRPVEKKVTDQIELFVTDAAGERPFDAWSGGEKKRVQIAVLLGIWQTAHDLCSVPPNFVFLDDCFGDLDEIGQSRVGELLRSITLEGRTVFVTSPIARSDIRFDQIWRVEKDGDFSTLRR